MTPWRRGVLVAGLVAFVARAAPVVGQTFTGPSPCRTGDTVQVTRPVSTVRLVQAGQFAYTEQNLTDILDVDAGVLGPLSADEQAQIRSIVIDEFRADPARIAKVLPKTHEVAELFRRGPAMDRAITRERDWELTVALAPKDPFVARWMAVAERHTAVVARTDSLVVTARAVDALLSSNDCVALLAGQPRSTAASRAAYVQALPAAFARMTPVEREQVAHAERRWNAMQFLFHYSDLRAIALKEIKAKVHGPSDAAGEARSLESTGLLFLGKMSQFAAHMAQIGNLGYTMRSSTEGINMATRRFMGQGP